MSRGGVATHDALALALAFFEAPGRFADLLHGRAPLPSGMTELLQVAAGDLPDDAPPPMFVSLPELQRAALFFIEQVLLARGADHYRVMGLAPGAGAEQIKEHHRLLMRLFHPDRRSVPDERADAAAARINRAYAVLRGAESRAAYYETLQPTAADAAPRAAYTPPMRVAGHRQPARAWPPAFRRHAPQVVLGAVALVAIGAVAMVYVNRVPAGAIGAGALAVAPRGNSAAARAESAGAAESVRPSEPAARVEFAAQASRRADPAPAARATDRPLPPKPEPGVAATAPLPAVAPKAPPTPMQVVAAGTTSATAPELPVGASAPSAAVPAVTRSEPAGPARTAAPGAPQASEAARAAPAQEVARTAAPTPAAVPAPPVVASATQSGDSLRTEQAREAATEPPTAVLQRFVVAYERGDLEALMALFDQDARIERGGRARIRSDYDALFRDSEMRSLRLRDLRWSGEGEVVRGEAAFVARVLRRGEADLREVAGSIRVELVRRGNRLLIIGLYHSVG